ncbi:MAG: DUF2905 domain-containing protein [Limnochordia bacterium]|jgi:hypothetical protein
MPELGRLFITLGIVLVAVGALMSFAGRLPFNLFRLPGDIFIRREGFTFVFPITSSILISIILSLCFYLFRRFGG